MVFCIIRIIPTVTILKLFSANFVDVVVALVLILVVRPFAYYVDFLSNRQRI